MDIDLWMAAVAILAMAIAMAMFVEVQWQLAEIAAVVLGKPKMGFYKKGG